MFWIGNSLLDDLFGHNARETLTDVLVGIDVTMIIDRKYCKALRCDTLAGQRVVHLAAGSP
jgi:hypothetical protein